MDKTANPEVRDDHAPNVARPPESMRPDRPEVMSQLGETETIEIAPGIHFESMVGAHNTARNLTTGFVTFQPGATLPTHTHSFGESITLLSGCATISVEGRVYQLKRLDNITIPRTLVHSSANHSQEPAVFHIAMASDSPTRELVDASFSIQEMPEDSTGHPGAEYVTRFDRAENYSPGPNTSFVDYFNRNLIPDIDMSGGYGAFQPSGRLPAHVHDFDESICIIEGEAACIVEGRRYLLSNKGTALQPRGRVHYFINETKEPMAMIWVYAGPMPERLVVDEQCATIEGNPWT